ncbi:DUF3558 family protein [Dietzia sp. Alg238-R159]|uniref:DUF3558 family protein n=1 Tax=Dietzia sp. Alg238-R159 TaxID=2305986 RepID=UPI0013CF5A76|nr:DUF3558 family protein [Dietzia sp. Alg238-R159]
MVAAGVVLSGCASADGGEDTSTTTSPAAAEEPGNPWDLPIEQRPALFDPCAEIPVEAVEEAVGAAVQPDDLVHHHRPDELYACGWKNDEVLFGVVGTWQDRQGFLDHSRLVPIDSQSIVQGRPSLRAAEVGDRGAENCYQVFFTSRGGVVLNVALMSVLREFRGERSVNACDVLDQIIEPVMQYVPEGDF